MADPVAASSAASDRSILSRRKDRDLWISRGHLRAATVGVILVAVCSFALGYAVGKVQMMIALWFAGVSWRTFR